MLDLLNTTTSGNLLPYCILMLAAFIEGPITILVAGAGVALGQLLPIPAYLAVVLGNLSADLCWYSLGRFGKLEWISHFMHKFKVKPAVLERLSENVQQYAPRLIFLSKLTIGFPIPTLITVGLHRVALRRWIALLVLGELLKSAALLAVGYLYASGIQQAFGGVRVVMGVITVLLVIIGLVIYRNHHKKSMSDSKENISLVEGQEKRSNEMARSKSLNGLALIPAYNEAHSIADVVRAAQIYLPVLVVNDGSRDATAQQARQAGAGVLSCRRNRGKGAALQAGMAQALKEGYEFVITLDADGQHDPAEIPRFLQTYQSAHTDLVIGQRDFSLMPPARRISNTLGTRIFSWAVGRPVPDNQSGYRLINRRVMELLHGSHQTGYEFEVEMIVRCMMNRCSMTWIPIRTIYGGEQSHISPLRHVLGFMQVSLWARRMLKMSLRMGYLYPEKYHIE